MNTFYHFIQDNNPYYTLAVEEYLLNTVCENQAVLLLYVHDNAVIVGRNQNVWKEVRVTPLHDSGGKIARRISGGGAVYHDENNINFSFIMHNNVYDVTRQMNVILSAVKSFGIEAYASGRNDILVDERKFSGNAFCKRKNTSFHHGTLLLNTDKHKLVKFLDVSEDKIRSKGIASVRARVINLCEITQVDVSSMAQALKTAFEDEYGTANPIDFIDETAVKRIKERNESYDWIFGNSPKCEIEVYDRFEWGGVTLGLNVDRGLITLAKIETDSLDVDFPEKVERALIGLEFESKKISSAIKNIAADERIISDLTNFVLREL